jgi:hypothetical protein
VLLAMESKIFQMVVLVCWTTTLHSLSHVSCGWPPSARFLEACHLLQDCSSHVADFGEEVEV